MHNLNECEKKSEYTEKNLNLTIQFSTFIWKSLVKLKPKNLNFESVYLNFNKFREKNQNDSDKI